MNTRSPTRRSFLVLLTAASACAHAPANSAESEAGCEQRQGLFVCQYGSVKSPIAREMFRREAARRGVYVQAISRGMTLEEHVSPDLAASLAADGIDAKADPLTQLKAQDASAADIVIFFDPLPAEIKPPGARDWSDLPSMNASYPEARDQLDAKIGALLDDIEAAGCNDLTRD